MKVLVSHGYGAGWSTWNSQAKYELATDPELVRLFEAGEHSAFEARAKQIMTSVTGEPDPYVCMLGYSDIRVEEAEGDFFIIEYDGNESLEMVETVAWRPREAKR